MSFLVVQTIPLSRDTRDALKSYSGVIARRDRTAYDIGQLVRESDYEFVLSMGLSPLSVTDWGLNTPLYNPMEVIFRTVTPGKMRTNFPEFLPPRLDGDVLYPVQGWVKGPGQHGQNKVLRLYERPSTERLGTNWDTQVHIEGDEYRVILVNDKVVQSFMRVDRNNDPTDREYSWVGVVNLDPEVKKRAKQFASVLGEYNFVLGLDIIRSRDGVVYILEANSSPGLNEATAGRVVKQIRINNAE